MRKQFFNILVTFLSRIWRFIGSTLVWTWPIIAIPMFAPIIWVLLKFDFPSQFDLAVVIISVVSSIHFIMCTLILGLPLRDARFEDNGAFNMVAYVSVLANIHVLLSIRDGVVERSAGLSLIVVLYALYCSFCYFYYYRKVGYLDKRQSIKILR